MNSLLSFNDCQGPFYVFYAPHSPSQTLDYFKVDPRHQMISSVNISVCVFILKYNKTTTT